MSRTILFKNDDEVIKAVVIENDIMIDYYEQSTTEALIPGSVFRVNVTDTVPALRAAFVKLSENVNGYLYKDNMIGLSGKDAQTVTLPLKKGREISVQILNLPSKTKGAGVTEKIAFDGLYTVVIKGENSVGVSAKIINQSRRKELLELIPPDKRKGYGVIFRTAAEKTPDALILAEYESLIKQHNIINDSELSGSVPRLLLRGKDLTQQLLQNSILSDTDQIVFTSTHDYENARSYLAKYLDDHKIRISLYSKDFDMFDVYGVSNQINRLSLKKLHLKCGGSIVIDKTEAMTVIDVNSGKNTAAENMDELIYKTNIEAAILIARQIKLRDISGIIVIDFIRTEIKEHKNGIHKIFTEELKKDSKTTRSYGFTKLGLYELTRKK